LYAGKTEDGLFPSSPSGKAAARKTLEEGWLEICRTEPNGRTTREIVQLTPAGTECLLTQAQPREVLEDFVRVLEAREDQLRRWLDQSQELVATVAAMRSVVGRWMESAGVPAAVSPRQSSAGCDLEEVEAALLTHLADWAGTAAAGQDCPLPELYKALSLRQHPPTIGQFHDCLRRLHADHRLYLHPWTGPLYLLPEPSLALLIGHNIAFYASLRR
jgi:hypothetical protein